MERAMAVKTTRITVETETLMIIRRAKVALAWCPECLSEVEVIMLDGGSLAEPFTAELVRKWLAAGRLHLWRTADGLARICVPSLLHCLDLEDVRSAGSSNESPLDIQGELL
jgi:hypothetical protein